MGLWFTVLRIFYSHLRLLLAFFFFFFKLYPFIDLLHATIYSLNNQSFAIYYFLSFTFLICIHHFCCEIYLCFLLGKHLVNCCLFHLFIRVITDSSKLLSVSLIHSCNFWFIYRVITLRVWCFGMFSLVYYFHWYRY